MSGVNRSADRVYAALIGGVLAVIVTATGSIWRAFETPEATTVELSFTLVTVLVQSMPGIVTLIGIAIAIYQAGPFGFFGAVMEVAGVNKIFNPSLDGGIGLVFVGALLVVTGSFLPWPKIYREMTS